MSSRRPSSRSLAVTGLAVAGIGVARWVSRWARTQQAQVAQAVSEVAAMRAEVSSSQAASQQAIIQATLTSIVSTTEKLTNNTVLAVTEAVEGVVGVMMGKRGEDGRIDQVEVGAEMDPGAAKWTDPPPWLAQDWTDNLLPDGENVSHAGVAGLRVGEQLIPGVPRPDMSAEEWVP